MVLTPPCRFSSLSVTTGTVAYIKTTVNILSLGHVPLDRYIKVLQSKLTCFLSVLVTTGYEYFH